MASVAAEEDDGGVPLDIDNVHMLLQVEHEQIQRRTFTNWINAQLSKRRPPSCVSDLFSDLRDGSRLLDLLEVMSGQTLKRQRGQGFFQQRANIESALDFLRKKNIKLVNINIPDIIDGRPSIVLGLVWTIILHCHIEELANALSFSSRHSSLDSLASLDSWSGSPVPVSPVPAGGTSPLHRRFRVSAKKALLMWVRDQCQKVGSSVSVKDFKSSWRSGEAFLAVLCSLRPQLVDLSLVQSRSHRENLEEAFHLAERELHIPRLLEPQDVDVKDPDDKSIMTYVAQFLQYSNDMPAPDDHLQIPAGERAQEVTCWLQQTCQELSEARTTTGNSGCTEKHQVRQSTRTGGPGGVTLVPLFASSVLFIRWQFLQGCRADLDLGLPPPLDSVVAWLQRAEAALTEEGGRVKDPADGAKEARAQQDTLKTLIKEMSHHVKILDDYHVADGSGNAVVSPEKFEEIKRRVTHIRVTTKYHGIKLEYQERRHTVLDLLNRVRAKIQTWTTSYRSKEAVLVLLQDWHETVERQDMLLILMDAVQNLKETADAYTGKATLGDDSQFVRRRVKEAEGEAESLSRAVAAARGTMDRVASAWDTYDRCLTSLQTWLAQMTQSQDMSEWTECQAKLNEAGNLLIEVTETSTGRLLAGQLGKVNKHWAECVKRTKFEIPGSPGFKERVGEPARRTHTQPETGPFVVARTKHAQQTGNVKLQAQGPGQLSPRTPLSRTSQRGARDPQGWPQHQRTNAQDGTTIVVPLVKIQMLPRPLTEPVLRFHSPLAQSVNDRESFSGSHAQALRQRDQPSPSSARTDVGPTARRSLPRSKHVTSSATEGNQSSPPSQTREPQSRTRAPPNPPQTDGTSPRPPVMVRGEVHSRARSMARSRLEKARVRLQGRIQQAMELFGGKEISESQAKKKQRALKTLQPVALGEFLDAAEGFGAFCSGPQLRELTLLSDSVRKQWEDVVGGAGSAEDRVESLRELCETLTPSQSSCLATERREEADQAQETRPGDTVLPQRRGRQLGASAPLRATGTSSADARPSSSLPERRSSDVPQQDLSPADDSLPPRSAWGVPTERKDSVQKQKPSLRAKELLLKARLLHMEESNEQTQTHIQAVIRSSTVETKQVAEWTVIPDAVRPPPQEEQRSGLEVPERCRTSFLVFQPRLKKIDQHSEMKDEMRPVGAEQMQRSEVFVPVEKCATKTRDGSPRQVGTQEREHRPPSAAEEESGLEAKRCKLDGEHQAGTWKSDGDAEDQRRGRRQVKKEGEEKEKESSVQRRAALLGALREIRGAAEQLRLHELTLPALQQRTRALTELQSRHAGLLSELRRVRDASSSGHCDASRSGEVEGSWAETTKAVNERLEQCCVLTELLKRFQCVRAELSGTLQKAESTIGEHASYMGKENLHKLYAKVQGTKAELNGLGDGVEEVRGVCRQIHTHLRQMPESDVVPFESDADALMDSWLDISERTDSHLENSRLCLTLWDGVLQLGAQVEKWSADELAAFARSPRFQSEDDVRALQKEIVAQEENVECFQRRAAEIQSLLRSADPPLELQVAEAQMRKTLEQLKELVSEAEDVREQTEAARGQIAARIAGCFECLQNVQDSLVALGGSDVATVLAKLKDLCRRLQAQDERVESLLDDLRALSSVCGPDALQSLSAEALRLHDEVGNSRRLFSEVQEQTQRNARDLHRARTELLGQLVSSLRRSNLQRSALVDDSCRLLERYHLFHADAPRGSEEKRCSVGGDVEAFRPSSRSAESWVGDLGRPGDAPLGGSPRGQSPVEQTLHRARAVVSAAADGEARLEKLRVAGNGLSHGPRDGGDLKREIQDGVRKMEERQRILLQSDEPHHRVLQTDAEIPSSYLDRPQEVRHRVGELQRQITGLPASFPWPGAAERRRACRLARQLWAESESLQITLGSLAGRRGGPAERTSDHDIWRDSSWDELDNCCVSLMAELKDACSRLEEGASNEEHFGQLLQDCHRKLTSLQDRTSACRAPRDGSAGPSTDVPALEALLHEVTDLEKDILQLEALKDSIADTSTAEAQASLSRQVGNLQSHKRALDGSIRGILAPLAANGNHRRVRQVKEEVSCVQAAVRGLADNVGNLFVNHEALADVSLIKQQWSAIQDFDCRLTDLAARVYGLQNIGESGITAEMLPADVLSTVDGVAEDFDRSIFLQNKQECEETTACVVRGVIGQLQRWSQMTVQAEPPSPSQATLEEGLQLQQYLREVLSDKDHLLNCLGTKVSKELEKDASDALGESARAPEASSKWPVSRGHGDVELDKRETAGETFGSDTSHSASPDETPAVCPPEPPALSATDQDNLDSVQNDNVITKGSRYTLDCVSVERADISVVCVPNSLMQTAKKDAVVSYPVPNPKIPDVLKSETRQEPRRLTSASPKIDSITDVKPNDDIANINTHSSHQNTGHRTTAGNASVLDSKPSALTMDNTQKISSSASGYLTAQSNASKGVADAQGVQERCENTSVTPKKVFTIVLDLEPHNMQDNKHVSTSEIPMNSKGAEMCDAKLTEGEVMGIPEEKSDLLTTLICPESDKMDSQNIGAQSETSKAFNDGQEKEKDTNASPNKVFTIVLELPVHQDVQQRVNVEASRCSQGAELCGAKPAAVSKSDLLSTLFAPEADDTDLKGRESNASRVADSPSEDADRVIAVSSSAQTSAEWQEVQSPSATLSETREPMPNVQSLSVAGCQLAGARAAEATFLSVKEEATDSRHSEKRTLSSDLCTAESPVRAGDASANRDTRTPAGDSEHAVGAGAAGEGRAESAAGEARGSEGPESNRSEEPVRRENTSLLKEGSESQSPASLEHTEVTQGQRTPHIDLNWYLKSSPGEQEIRLVRTVQWVLACRYQPAELDVTAMAQQLEEAEGYRSCVQEQVATMKSTSAAKDCDPNALRRAEGQWRAALLDASATVQVKAAQLDQVKQYHRQMKLTRAFLEVLAAEREKMSLNALGSSAVQADKLQALLQTMEQKKSIMEELLHLSSQMSVHLSYAESSGALLAQLGDVQEQWRLLEASIKRALEHAANSTSQSSVLVKEAEQLKAKLEDLQSSDFENNDSKSDLESVCLTTDLKLYHQLYLHLQSQSEALVHFSLGQKEKDKVQNHLQELGSLLDVTKKKLHDSTCGCGDVSSAKINKQLKDLIVWAKQAENHISTGKKLALFPEEARVQIADMKKFQTGILSRRSKMRVQVEGMTGVASDMEKEESDQVLKTIEDLYEAIADSLDHVLDTMKKHLQKREKLLSQLASMDAWLAESHATRDACAHVENVSKADVQKLESELRSHKLAAAEIRSRLKLAEAMAEGCKDITVGLSPGESRYLVNRLSGLWTELDGLLAHENATSWELEELIHERTSSDEELSIIQTSLEKISIDLEQQRFPLTQETLSMVAHLTHVLVENRCQAQELQHCNEAKRSALLHTIGELQDKCKALSRSAFEQDKYLHLRRQMEESRDIAKEQIRRAREKSVSVGERFRLCQTLLVELPLVKTQCQEAGDQLEALAQELYPSQLHAERQRIRHTVETLVSMENSVTDDIINMEAKLLLGLRFSSELPALMELFRRTRAELEGAEPVDPDEKAIDGALRRYWVIWRNMKSGMRVVEALGRKQKVNLKDYEELHSLRDAAMQECHLGMESLSQARESLKDYQWAAQGAIAYLHNAEATFLSALGGFLDCTEEQRQTQQALEALEEGFQAHISHLVELLPQQPCLSHRKVEELHISILSQLLVGRAVLEAQAQLRLESLQRCAVRQQSHRSCHEDVRQRLSGFEARLSECAAVQVTSYDKCVAQQKRARLLMDDLCSLAGKIEDLRAACPMQGCGVGKDGELGALWRRWVALRRGVGLLMAHVEQRQEEWKDITTSMQQCCSFLASLQAEVPDSSTVSFAQEIPQELLAQAEIHQAGLEQEQQDLASLEHRLEHALSLSNSLDPVSPGPVGKTLVKIQENVRSLKERNLMIVAAAQAEEKEREQVLEEIEEVEKHVFAIVPKLEACWNPSQGQKAKLECIVDGVQSRYAEIPADIGKRLQEVQQRVEELVKGSDPVRKLAGRVVELGSGLQKVTALLEQKSPTVGEAQNVLKRVWDELDTWHSRLMLLESEMQDLAEEQPDQAHALMDHIAQPLQLHQNASQMAEYRTAFLSKIPACLRQFEDISYSATCWLDEAQSWLSAACSFTTARSLQNHANSLQLVLDDSLRIRDMLQDFRPVLAEISAVCDVGTQEKTLDHNDQRVHQMQRNLLEPLEQLLQAAVAVEAMEAEVKTMEKNVPKIRTILSSMDDTNITLAEHLHNREVILANVQSIRTTLEEMEKCKGELPLPQGAEESLLVFSRARLLLQPLEELGKLTQYQASLLERLLAGWPPAELLSDLETWLKKQEASLGREEETFLEAEDAAQIAEVLQHYRELKAGIVSGQLLVDFLCQSRPQAAGADVLALQSERTMFAETLGDLRLRWLHLQGELESQIRGAEQTRRTCAVRERRLQHLRGWIAQQKEQLSRWEQPASRTRARGALREWEAVVGRGEEVAAALQRLKAARVHAGSEEERPCDVAFSSQAEGVSRACEDLSQQMEALRPALQQTVEQWSRFHGDLREVSLQASELRCALQHQRAPLFSLEQAEGYVDLLRELQGKAEKGEELWAAVEKSFPSLVKTLHCGAAQAMGEQVEAEQKRWKNATRELKDERVKAGETVSLWQEHSRLCENSSLHLRRLWLQWEELLSSSRSRDRDTQALIQSVEKLQDVAENLQSGVNDALEASKPLIGRLAPLAANLIQSEIRLLSRDLLLLTRAMSGKKKSLQEDLEDQKLFHTCLQSLEKQTQNIKDKLKAGSEDQDSVKVLLELGDLFPPLVDVREMSSYLTLDNRDAERLRALSSEWVEGVTRTSDMNRELQAERQSHQTFQEKCDNLTHLKEKLAEESRKAESPSSLQEILTVQQRLQADMITGHQLLQGLLCDAVTSMEKETGEKRSELVARVSSVREGWFSAVALAGRCRSVAKEQLRQRRIYNHGLKLLWKLLRDVGPLLPPAGTALCTPQQLRSCADDYQCVQGALDVHSAVYRQTLEAGQRLCETMRESEWRSRLQSELRAIGEAWKGTTSRLERRRDLHHSAVQKWSRCQDGIASIACDLDEVKTRMLERPEDSEKLIQETELSLQRLASGLRELRTMKTDLSQYITAGDSALLEQQLEQLHGQWEELCMKVSLRKQEIADRLNAWTIFNDKNREFCDWLAQMESKVCRSADLSIEEMVEKLKKDCMEEINLFSENKSHLKQLGEQLLLASDEAKQTQVGGSLREVNQRWHNLFRHIEARVKKLTETLVTVQQLDKNMSNLRSWLSRIEAELSRPITYSVCHHQEIQRRLAEQQELQRDIEQHTEGVASVLGLCDVLLRDEDAAGAAEAEGDSLQETSRSLDQRWRTICSLALDRRLRIEETWRLWCKFLEDYSRFEDWLKMAERTAANPNSAGVLYTAAKEELKKFEGFQRQVHERLTQLEIVNNQYRRLARENRTDRASQLKVMVHEGNRRWDVLHRRVAAILRRLKYFTSQREEFEGTRESMLVWLTELDLQLTNVEHFSESDVHHKMRQLNSFQKEITLNTERIDGLIVFGEGLIQRSSPQDAALIEDELEELHAYCQEVFSRLVRFHQRLSQPPVREEPELSGATFSLESSLELIGRPWLGRGNFSLPATPTHLLASPLERSGRETPVSVDSLPLEWDHTGDVGASSSHEDEDDEEEEEEEEEEEQQEGEEGVYFSALSVPSRSVVVHESPVWDADTPPLLLPPGDHTGAAPPLTSTPRKKSYLGLMSQCSGSIEDIKRVSLILDDDGEQRRQQQELGLTGLTASDKQSGVIERWELLQAQARSPRPGGPQGPDRLRSELDDLASWLASVSPELERLQRSNPAASVADMEAGARELKEMQRMFTQHKSTMLSVNLRAPEAPELQPRLTGVNRDWSRVCTGLQRWDASLRKTLLRCREFHETLHSLLLWLAHAESRRYAVDIGRRDTPVRALQQHRNTLAGLREELRGRQAQQASLQALWSQLRPEGGGDHGGEDGDDGERSDEAQEKLHVTGSKLKLLLRDVDLDLSGLQQRLNGEPASDVPDQSVSADCSRDAARARTGSSVAR
ncbi:putative nesprin-2-like [Scophthalmus maximus]|uniref:Putative nesprin-2-like n=1 Tax=Scophthalmus maximus TaxID=52904 RepID=A0A2U9CUP4_SCOMX|nr:putative nesprin-2-like [Scophthalmus maximus]